MDRTARQMAKWIYAGRGRNFHFSVANCIPRLSAGVRAPVSLVFGRYFPISNGVNVAFFRTTFARGHAKGGSPSGYPSICLRIVRTPCHLVARGHANLFLIDEIGTDSSAYEFLINAPSARGRERNATRKNIKGRRFYSKPARLLYDSPVNRKARARAIVPFSISRC